MHLFQTNVPSSHLGFGFTCSVQTYCTCYTPTSTDQPNLWLLAFNYRQLHVSKSNHHPSPPECAGKAGHQCWAAVFQLQITWTTPRRKAWSLQLSRFWFSVYWVPFWVLDLPVLTLSVIPTRRFWDPPESIPGIPYAVSKTSHADRFLPTIGKNTVFSLIPRLSSIYL